MNSIISFPKRGTYRDPSWRGNTTTERIKQNPNWQAKIRQVLQQTGQSTERGVWALKAA